MAMAGIGLVYCGQEYCRNEYVNINSASCCQDCHDAITCHDCGCWNGCPACGDDRDTKVYFCEECRPMVHCDRCDRGFCTMHKDIKQFEICGVCTIPLCQRCHGIFDICEQCNVYICCYHKQEMQRCRLLEVQDSYNCGHDGLYWKVRDRQF